MLLVCCQNGKLLDEKYQKLKSQNFTQQLKEAPHFIGTDYFDSICIMLNDSIASGKYVQVSIFDSIDIEKEEINYGFKLSSVDYFNSGLESYDIDVYCLKSIDSLLYNDNIVKVNEISTKVQEYIANPQNDEYLSEKYSEKNDLLGEIMVSKGTVVLTFSKDKSLGIDIEEWQLYFSVLEQFKIAFVTLRNEYALTKWNIGYGELQFERKVALIKLYPMEIELNFKYCCGIPVSQPPLHEGMNEFLDSFYD